MGWIYNGAEFIKANKAQRQAYDKYQQHLLIKEGLAEPFTIPAIALAGAAAAGVLTVGSLAALFWGPVKDIVEEGIETVGEIPGKIKTIIIETVEEAGVSREETPKFLSDATACLRVHPAHTVILGQKVPDFLRGFKLAACMTKKGWADDIAIQGLKNLF